MKRLLLILLYTSFFIVPTFSQIRLRSDFIQKSTLNINNKKVGEGSMSIYKGDLDIPLTLKLYRPSWFISIKNTYAKYEQSNESLYKPYSELVNTNLYLRHIRPINPKLTLAFVAGTGIYIDTTDFSMVRSDNIIYTSAGMAIWRPRPGFSWGVGVAATTIYKDILIVPLIFVDWSMGQKYKIRIASIYDLTIELSTQMTKTLSLKAIGELVRIGTPTNKLGEKCYLSTNYYVIGLRPEFNLNNKFKLSFTAGFTASNVITEKDRAVKYLFKDGMKCKKEPAPYFSIALFYNWWNFKMRPDVTK